MEHDRLMTETFDSTTFATLARSRTALLTTFRRTGQAVTSPVSLAVKDGRAYFVTAAAAGRRSDSRTPTGSN